MKYNSCLLDRLYSTKCNYMQIHLLSVTSYAFHAPKEKKRKRKEKKEKKDAAHTKEAVHTSV